ncbi:glutaredoxin [Thermococcus indicus]|uniref:Glutaredoxin n=1 Tax=Thermococcus indicus TaxID=2586643 RepID=A0A4Y5SLU5_9EURY|nr:glutaredoxin [Thermococcus indicus]QDA31159.1 glutaredoxin [Thermococcus indicus]
MKKFGVVLLLMILIGFGAGCITDSNGTAPTQTSPSDHGYVTVNGTKIYLDEIHFYMYGMQTCPHCHKMREEIPKAYGNDSLTYYELVNNEENANLFQRIYQLTGIQGVPAIAITYNGTLYAVLEGEFNVTAVPKIIYTGMENNGVILAVGGKVYLLPRDKDNSEEVINELYELFVEHRMPSWNSNSTSG